MKKISLFIAALWMVAAAGTVKANDSIVIDGNFSDEYTGCSVSWVFDDPALDLLIEGSWTDQFKTADVFACPSKWNGMEKDEWEWDNIGVSESTT